MMSVVQAALENDASERGRGDQCVRFPGVPPQGLLAQYVLSRFERSSADGAELTVHRGYDDGVDVPAFRHLPPVGGPGRSNRSGCTRGARRVEVGHGRHRVASRRRDLRSPATYQSTPDHTNSHGVEG